MQQDSGVLTDIHFQLLVGIMIVQNAQFEKKKMIRKKILSTRKDSRPLKTSRLKTDRAPGMRHAGLTSPSSTDDPKLTGLFF